MNIGEREAVMYDRIGFVYSELQRLMGAIYDGQEFSREDLLDALGDLSNKVLNTKEEYVASYMGNDASLLYSVDCERHALNQALASTNGRSQSR